jgi:hypothetical protein
MVSNNQSGVWETDGTLAHFAACTGDWKIASVNSALKLWRRKNRNRNWMRSLTPYDPPFVSMSSVSGDSLPRGLSALRRMGINCGTGALPKIQNSKVIAYEPPPNLVDPVHGIRRLPVRQRQECVFAQCGDHRSLSWGVDWICAGNYVREQSAPQSTRKRWSSPFGLITMVLAARQQVNTILMHPVREVPQSRTGK